MVNHISRRASCFVFLLVALMLAASAAFAQVQPDNNVEQPAVQVISTVTASASAERVRFSSPNTVVQLRLEVYDEGGQKLLDTEQRGGITNRILKIEIRPNPYTLGTCGVELSRSGKNPLHFPLHVAERVTSRAMLSACKLLLLRGIFGGGDRNRTDE